MRVGAGRPGWHLKVEADLNIDVRRFERDGLIDRCYTGLWSWRDPDTMEVTSSVHLTLRTDAVVLQFVLEGDSVVQSIRLERTLCHFGGTRTWFKCPACDRRVAILYIGSHLFACRKCHDLVYASQSEDALDRAWRKVDKVKKKLGGSDRRPKGMHASTYCDLLRRLERCERERRSAAVQRMLRYL